MATNLPKKIIDALPKQFSYTQQMGLGAPPRPIVPENATPIRSTEMGRNIIGYEIPLEKPADYPETDALGFPVPPLVAKYDVNGKLLKIESQQRYFADNEYHIQPQYSATGEFITDSASTNAANSGSLFGDIKRDLGPIILAALAGNAAAGNLSGLFGGGGAGAAAGGASAADIAASNALASANVAGYAGTELAAISAADVAASNALAAANTAGYTGSFASTPATGVTAGGGAITGGSVPTGGAATTGMLSGEPITPSAPSAPPAAPAAPVAAATGATDPSVLDYISKATGIPLDLLKTFAPSVITGLLSAGGSYLTSEKAIEAAKIQAEAQKEAARIAADAARFRPVGVTTRFGSSNFTTDAAGNVTGAGYTPSAEILDYQDRLKALADRGLTDAEGARAGYQPLTGASDSLFNLGKSYLSKTPEEAAQEYIAKQTALLTPSRENQLAELRNRQFQTGRGGAATAQGGSLMNTNPELAAYYNSLAQQDLVLAAQADEEARRRISYGAGLFDTGSSLRGKYYSGVTGAYAPFTTAVDTSSALDRLARESLDLSTSIGSRVSTANANAGRLTSEGIIASANTMAPANAYSGAGNLITGAANSPVLTNAINSAFGVQPSQTTSDAEKLRILKQIFGT